MLKGEEFAAELEQKNTNINVFINLLNLWDSMTSEERGRAIELSNVRLVGREKRK